MSAQPPDEPGQERVDPLLPLGRPQGRSERDGAVSGRLGNRISAEFPTVHRPSASEVDASVAETDVEVDEVPAPATPTKSGTSDVSRETLPKRDEGVSRGTSKGQSGQPTESPIAAAMERDLQRQRALMTREFPTPSATRVMTVANQKGGVGKTTTTVNLAAALADAGLTVLVIDTDPQGNASTALSVPHHSDVLSIYDVLVDDVPLCDVVQACPDIPGLYCAPATIDLAGAEIELVGMEQRETRTKKAIEAYAQWLAEKGHPRLDYVFIDCPPSLGLLTINAFTAAQEVLIPIQCEYYALEGLSQLLKNIELIKTHLNPALHVSTILLTMFDGRTRLSSQVADEVRTHFPQQVIGASIPRSVRISEAPSHGQTVITYDRSSAGALSYLEAAAEIAERGAKMSVKKQGAQA